MGSNLSSFNNLKGFNAEKILNSFVGPLEDKLKNKTIDNPEDFEKAIVDIYLEINKTFPGRHYELPALEEIKKFYNDLKNEKQDRKKKIVEFFEKNLKLQKLDNLTMLTGLGVPPAAIAAKRAGERLPQVKNIRFVPDVLFVPSTTVLAVMITKFYWKKW